MDLTRHQRQERNDMRSRTVLLCSLGLNLLLTAGVLGLIRRQSASASVSAATNEGPAVSSEAWLLAAEAAAVEPAGAVANQPAVRFRWSQLESEDLRSYVGNLRAVHCPESVIRDLVFFDLERLYSSK